MKIHSMVGIITNSSTEIFTWADEESIDNIKKLVDAILYNVGDENTFEDFFSAEIKYDEYTYKKWDALSEEEKERFHNNIHEWVKANWDYEWPTQSRVSIKDIYTGEEVEWSNLLSSIYSQDAIYNG